MTDEIKTPETKKTKEPMVDLFIERAEGKDDPNVFISINGKNWLLPKGQVSKVPQAVADEYKRSQEAKAQFYAKSDAFVEAALK